jgi:Fe-S-cluster-containing hydrogenase component 2
MKVVRKIINIQEELCNGCGQCVPACAEGALAIVDGKARMIAEIYCDGLGACLGDCPTGALSIVEREADDFDEDAVQALMHAREEQMFHPGAAPACPSAKLQTFQPSTSCPSANQLRTMPGTGEQGGSALTHWPVQIRLVPPSAPFLQDADLLIAADCTPLAYPHFHRELLQGRRVLMGCPKFDDAEAYVKKFTEIFQTARIKSITISIMEVPCCASMRQIVKDALRRSGKNLPVQEVVISAGGEILRQKEMSV